MITRTVVFDSVKRRQTVNYVCIRCGKKRAKVVITEYTVNPFNTNADGSQAGEKCAKCKDETVAERDAARKQIAVHPTGNPNV